ncbi:MAG: hypothetical protein EPO52_17555 [Herbiconiux sp.]|uniref:hypothetical protein n=1 Tax=Herbiconiux sp. TaxID=1871186 RepID=UPI00121A97E3|nr:hypothetical protein [Herbiconiux sp.]TAJ46339.1 MAG: hypothetical protein EPO52_17555 [Herbiconiux sp.]
MTYTALDTLKDTVLRVEDKIGVAQDHLSGSRDIDDEDDAMQILEYARRLLWEALADHVAGVSPAFPHYPTAASHQDAHTYSDGSTICELIDLSDGAGVFYFPRYDGDRDAFINMFETGRRARLTLVEGTADGNDH